MEGGMITEVTGLRCAHCGNDLLEFTFRRDKAPLEQVFCSRECTEKFDHKNLTRGLLNNAFVLFKDGCEWRKSQGLPV